MSALSWFSMLGAMFGGLAIALPAWLRHDPLAIWRCSRKSTAAHAALFENSAESETGIETRSDGEGDKPEDERPA